MPATRTDDEVTYSEAVEAAQDAAPVPIRRWVFTFGGDHALTIRSEYPITDEGAGIPLARRYLVIEAPTEAAARVRFVDLFGPGRFGEVYPDDETAAAMIARHRLTELTLWPVTP
jgi:hypothetical protein